MHKAVDRTVFFVSVAVVATFVAWGVIQPRGLEAFATSGLAAVARRFGWFYLLATALFLGFSLMLAFSRYGDIRLGRDDDEPEYSYPSWFAMLFSAGMGIGLVFWGVAEPMYHYTDPPMGLAPRATPEAARLALRYCFFHWGLHPWAIYTVVGLSIAYFRFRKGEPGLISTTCRPLLGARVDGPLGRAIDVLAIIATAFGVATSLGLGALQINGGLAHLFGVPNTTTTRLAIIATVTVLFMASATTGLDRGILLLSNVNMGVATGLLVFVLVVGPTSFIVDAFTTTLGGYAGNLIPMSFRLTPFSRGTWVGSWTLFYWAWWIAWAPFVGTFIARVSRGRTVREFVLGVLLVPTLVGALWFAAFGGSALSLELFGGRGIAAAARADVTSALFVTLRQFPLGQALVALATLLIVTFFVTSADSATFVLGMLSSRGALDPPLPTKVAWGVLQSSVAAVLLVSGGLNGLQSVAILAALPFAVVMVAMVVSLRRALRAEVDEARQRQLARLRELDALLAERARARERGDAAEPPLSGS